MTTIAQVGCARCGTILDPNHRFCPECGLPASGEGVLSTQIDELRHRIEAQTAASAEHPWRRFAMLSIAAVIPAFVLALGIVLFNRSLFERLFPGPETPQLPVQVHGGTRHELEWVEVPAGTFRSGDPDEGATGYVPYSFRISKYEVTNALWGTYLDREERRLREEGLLDESFPGESGGWAHDIGKRPWFDPAKANHPVCYVSPVAVAHFCRWLTNRIAQPGVEIRIPTRLEWEYAARGTDGREYPWGDEFYIPAPPRSGGQPMLREGISKGPYHVDNRELRNDDTSPFGVVAMGTNVSEWTLMLQVFTDRRSVTEADPLGRQFEGGVAELRVQTLADTVRSKVTPDSKTSAVVTWSGASWAHDAQKGEHVAKAWKTVTYDVSGRLPQIGVRLVKVRVPN